MFDLKILFFKKKNFADVFVVILFLKKKNIKK
jgi:hypothetical protein